MNIQMVPFNHINPAPYNPRQDLQPGQPAYEKLKRSIAEFGYVEPLVWNQRTGNLVGGHQRFKILMGQGIQQAEVSVVDLPLEREKALNVALNKIQGDWDENKLAILLDELSKVPEFDAGLTGFDLPEVSQLMDRQKTSADDEFDVQAAVEAINEPITKLGDLIPLGQHRILCGDSSKANDLQRLIGEEKATLLHTDPPYNVAYYGGNRPTAEGRPKPSRQWEQIYSDNLSQSEYEAWLAGIMTTATPYLAPGAACYIWNGHRQFGPMHQMLVGLGFHISCVITWAKPNFAIGYGDYNQATEFCLYGWKADAPHQWYGPTNETTLWEIKRDPTKSYVHPTQKPLALAQRAIRNSSVREGLVLDLFLGSGSTLMAAEGLGRRCYGLEIDPRYCDAIVRRYIALVGKDQVSEEVRQRYCHEMPHV